MTKNRQAQITMLQTWAETHQLPTITRVQLKVLCKTYQIPMPQWFLKTPLYKTAFRGVYSLTQFPTVDTVELSDGDTSMVDSKSMAVVEDRRPTPSDAPVPPPANEPVFRKGKILDVEVEVCALVAQVIPLPTKPGRMPDAVQLVPAIAPNFQPFGNFDDLKKILASKQFYPLFITGHSGTGKTFSIEQACAQLGLKFVCVSMTPETDEGDLLGNYVLSDNSMVWKDGPVTQAAREGAVLLLDEIDYGAANLATLQRVLEGKPFLLKKRNEVVTPAPGFTVLATANTKGKGSDNGRYMFTNVLNEAFLERFPITFEQEWAPRLVEKKIVVKELQLAGAADAAFAERLIDWATMIRKTFTEGGCMEVISTRRLVQICKAYAIFRDKLKAITYCIQRFDKETELSFLDLYMKLDGTIQPLPGETLEGQPGPVEGPVPASTGVVTT